MQNSNEVDKYAISKTLVAQGVAMPLAFILVRFVPYKTSLSPFNVALIPYVLLQTTLIFFFIYPLFQGYEIRNNQVHDYTDIRYWFQFSLICGFLYILAAFLTSSTTWMLLALPALVFLIPGWVGDSSFQDDSRTQTDDWW